LRALALIPLLLTIPTGFAYTVYRCRADGVAHRTCCCPRAKAPDGPAVKRPCCCDVQQVLVGRAAPGVETAKTDAAPAAATLPSAPVLVRLGDSDPVVADQPLRAGPLIFVLKRSFLL
jgi:hypothetical protein